MNARFKVVGRINGKQGATVTVHRDRGLIEVRPLRERRSYTLPLLEVAEIIVARVVKFELREKEGK